VPSSDISNPFDEWRHTRLQVKELRTEWCRNEDEKGLVHTVIYKRTERCMRLHSYEITMVGSVVGVDEGLQSQLYHAIAVGQRVLQGEQFEPLYKMGQHRREPHVVARENGYPGVQREGGSHIDN